MPDQRQTLGQHGENWVASQLERDGYAILARNWRQSSGELDIVARRDDELVIVEVRTRRGPLPTAIEAALSSITPAKKARLLSLAEAFRAAYDLEDLAWRIDVAAVGCERGAFRMEIIHDAVDW